VASRLVRGRALLAKRLIRRAQVLTGVFTMTLAGGAAQAALPSTLVHSTVQAAALVAAGKLTAQGVLSAQALLLAQGVIQSMVWNKMKLGVFALIVVLVCGIGYGTFALSSSNAGAQPAAEKKAPQDPVRPDGPKPASEAGPKLGADTLKPIRSLPGHKDRVTSAAYSPDGRWIATAGWDGTARIWDAQTGKEVRRLDVPAPRDYNPAHLSRILFSPDNEFIVVAQQAAPNEAGVMVWKRRTGEKVHEFPGGTGSVAISPDGKLIACGGFGLTGGIRIYELATGKMVREMHGPQTHIFSLTFSPDGKMLVSTGPLPRPDRGDGIERLGHMPAVIRVWDVTTGKVRPSTLQKLEPGGLGQCLALSPDGRTLALANSLWEIATGGGRAGLTGHTDVVCAVAFSPDGRTLASGSMDGTVRLWDLPSGKEVGRFGKWVPMFKGGWVLAVAFSPDGRSLVSGGLNKTAEIWDVSRIVSRITGRPRTSAERSPADLEADWKDLAGDPAAGYAALGRLVSSPERGVPFLGKQLQNAKPVDTKRIERLIVDLNDGRFQIREKAAKELEALTDRAVPTLQKALAGGLSLEAKRRVEALLDRLEGVGPSVETIREVRVVEALEWIGNAEARRLLDKLAAGPPDTRLTQEAKAAAERLGKR
jgi:WD40 repeat protein